MLHLLKEKSKIGYKPKTRKKYEVYRPGQQSTQVIKLQPPEPGVIQKPPGIKKIVPIVHQNYDADKDREMKRERVVFI